MDSPAILPSRERIDQKKKTFLDISEAFPKDRSICFNVSIMWGVISKEVWENEYQSKLVIPKGMKVEPIYNGYAELKGANKADNDDPDVEKGFFLFGIKISCPRCRESMQIIRHDFILDHSLNGINFSIFPTPICPHCDQKFSVLMSEVKNEGEGGS